MILSFVVLRYEKLLINKHQGLSPSQIYNHFLPRIKIGESI